MLFSSHELILVFLQLALAGYFAMRPFASKSAVLFWLIGASLTFYAVPEGPVLANQSEASSGNENTTISPMLDAIAWCSGSYKPNGSSKPPSDFTAVTGWGQVYQRAGAPAYSNPNAAVEVANAKAYVHLKSTGGLVLVQDQAAVRPTALMTLQSACSLRSTSWLSQTTSPSDVMTGFCEHQGERLMAFVATVCHTKHLSSETLIAFSQSYHRQSNHIEDKMCCHDVFGSEPRTRYASTQTKCTRYGRNSVSGNWGRIHLRKVNGNFYLGHHQTEHSWDERWISCRSAHELQLVSRLERRRAERAAG